MYVCLKIDKSKFGRLLLINCLHKTQNCKRKSLNLTANEKLMEMKYKKCKKKFLLLRACVCELD